MKKISTICDMDLLYELKNIYLLQTTKNETG